MDIRLMEYVLAVYEESSFTKAAEKLHVSQPSLSQQVAKLERELGLRLFQRGPGPITPTADGMRFVERAYDIVHLRNDLNQEMQERSQAWATVSPLAQRPSQGDGCCLTFCERFMRCIQVCSFG